MFRNVLLMFFCCTISTSHMFAADLSQESQRKADIALRGFDDTIMRINSGICRITGKTIETNGNVINDDILIAFDYGAHCYRFDNGNLKRTLLTPEFYYEVWHPNTQGVSVTRSPASNPEVTSIHCSFVDIQSVFRFTPVGPKRPFSYQQSDFHQKIGEIIKTGYEELPNGLVRIMTDIPLPPTAPKIYTEYIINTNEGHIVQQIKVSIGYTFDVSWKNINQTWVPVAYVFDSGQNFGVEWTIEWEQVNEKVDPKYFCLEEMLADQEDGALMLSDELGTGTIIIGRVGGGHEPITDFLSEEFKPGSYSPFRNIFMYLGVCLIILALGKKAYDYWRARASA